MRKFLRLIKYDLNIGTKKNNIKMMVFCILILIMCIIGKVNISRMEELYDVRATILDYFCYMVNNVKHIPKGMYELYAIPVLWLLIQAMIAYIIGYYPVEDLYTYGSQVLIRSESRGRWWISKCLWNSIMVLFMYAVLYTGVIITSVIGKSNMNMSLSEQIITKICNVSELNGDKFEYVIILIVMPVIVSMTLSMIQMTISLMFYPIIGFILTQSVVFLSTIFEYRFLISNYGLLSHNNVASGSNIIYSQGLFICIMLYIVSLVAGYVYFLRCNLLPKESV